MNKCKLTLQSILIIIIKYSMSQEKAFAEIATEMLEIKSALASAHRQEKLSILEPAMTGFGVKFGSDIEKFKLSLEAMVLKYEQDKLTVLQIDTMSKFVQQNTSHWKKVKSAFG